MQSNPENPGLVSEWSPSITEISGARHKRVKCLLSFFQQKFRICIVSECNRVVDFGEL